MKSRKVPKLIKSRNVPMLSGNTGISTSTTSRKSIVFKDTAWNHTLLRECLERDILTTFMMPSCTSLLIITAIKLLLIKICYWNTFIPLYVCFIIFGYDLYYLVLSEYILAFSLVIYYIQTSTFKLFLNISSFVINKDNIICESQTYACLPRIFFCKRKVPTHHYPFFHLILGEKKIHNMWDK